jgi:hypothetical protein
VKEAETGNITEPRCVTAKVREVALLTPEGLCLMWVKFHYINKLGLADLLSNLVFKMQDIDEGGVRDQWLLIWILQSLRIIPGNYSLSRTHWRYQCNLVSFVQYQVRGQLVHILQVDSDGAVI